MFSKSQLLSASVLLCLSISAYAQEVGSQQQILVGGVTSYKQFNEAPFILTSGPNGTWQTNFVTKMPYSRFSQLTSFDCKDAFCAAVGQYYPFSNLTIQKPMIAVLDQQDWYFVKEIENLPNMNFGGFTSVACLKTACVAGGYYDNFNYQQRPVVIARGSGQKWRLVDDIKVSAEVKNATISSLKCVNEQTCYASGYYMNAQDQLNGLLLTSQDAGNSWQSVKLPAKSIESMACVGDTCVLGGYDGERELEAPALLTLKNNQIQKAALKLPENVTQGKINKVYCDQSQCIALGLFNTKSDGVESLVAISEDQGKNWQMLPYKIKDVDNIFLHDVSCFSSSLCTVLGGYNLDQRIRPLVLNIQKANGQAKIVENKSLPLVPEDQDLSAVQCQANSCVIGGDASIKPAYKSPFMLKSEDGGLSWQRVTNIPYLDVARYSRITTIYNRN